MATLMKTKKKTKPKIIELNEPIVNCGSDQTLTNDQNTVPTETTRILPESRVDSNVVDINDSPSAPPEDQYEYRPTGLMNPDIRADFMAKVFGVLFFQKLSFSVMIGLFTFIPPLRKFARKNIFNPLFLGSYIGLPLFIVVIIVMAIFPKIRRKIAKLSFAVLTICLALLLSYGISQPKTATAFLYQMGFTNICDLGVIMGSKRKMDFTKWRYILMIPAVMTGASVAAPYILPKTSLNYTIWPSIATTFGSFYLMANTVPVIRHNDLDIKPEEPVFAAMQLYLNPEQSIRHKINKWFFGTPERQRRGYSAI